MKRRFGRVQTLFTNACRFQPVIQSLNSHHNRRIPRKNSKSLSSESRYRFANQSVFYGIICLLRQILFNLFRRGLDSQPASPSPDHMCCLVTIHAGPPQATLDPASCFYIRHETSGVWPAPEASPVPREERSRPPSANSPGCPPP
jgi:hypothetical protein